jgi:hypothetical protein
MHDNRGQTTRIGVYKLNQNGVSCEIAEARELSSIKLTRDRFSTNIGAGRGLGEKEKRECSER